MKHVKTALFGAVALAGLSGTAFAAMTAAATCPLRDLSTFQYAGNDCNVWRVANYAPLLKKYGLTFEGELSGGVLINPDGSGPYQGTLGYNDARGFQFGQGYVSLARPVPKDNEGFFLGGRFDALYGSDFYYVTSAGWDGKRQGDLPLWHNPNYTYGSALPQAYLEAAYKDLDVKAGYFYTNFSDESAIAKDNFFNTHSYAFIFGEPVNDAGIVVSKNIAPGWKLSGGLVQEWDRFDLSGSGENFNNILGGISYTAPRYSVALNMQTGETSAFNLPGLRPTATRDVANLMGTVNINPRLNYTIGGLYGVQRHSFGFNALDAGQASWYGINQQLLYTIDNKWSAGGRLEWLEDPQGYLVTGFRTGNPDALFRLPGSFYEGTAGVNYKPLPNFTLRGEVREDLYDGRGGYRAPLVFSPPPSQPFSDNTSKTQTTFGLNAIVQF